MPYFLIASGPTGAGKTSSIQATVRKLSLSPVHTTILLDELVEATPMYQDGVHDLLHKSCPDAFHRGTAKEVQQKRAKSCANHVVVSDEAVETFGKMYWNARRNGCMCGKEVCDCGQLNKIHMKKAMSELKNIVLETTGAKSPLWVFDLNNIDRYDVIIVYTVANMPTLQQRIQTRAKKSIMAYLEAHYAMHERGEHQRVGHLSEGYPRIPPYRDEYLYDAVTNISNVMHSVVYHQDSSKPYRVLIYDNNGSTVKELYDSQTSKPWPVWPDLFGLDRLKGAATDNVPATPAYPKATKSRRRSSKASTKIISSRISRTNGKVSKKRMASPRPRQTRTSPKPSGASGKRAAYSRRKREVLSLGPR